MLHVTKQSYWNKLIRIFFQLTVAAFSMEASVARAFEIVRELSAFSKVLAWIWHASALDCKRVIIKHKYSKMNSQLVIWPLITCTLNIFVIFCFRFCFVVNSKASVIYFGHCAHIRKTSNTLLAGPREAGMGMNYFRDARVISILISVWKPFLITILFQREGESTTAVFLLFYIPNFLKPVLFLPQMPRTNVQQLSHFPI